VGRRRFRQRSVFSAGTIDTELTFVLDLTRVASVAVMEWRTSKEKEAEIMDYYTSVIGPMVADNPDTYRIRLLEVDNATVLQGLSYETTEKTSLKAYLSIVEFETEEWPWDLAFKLSEDKQWAEYFEAQKEVVSRRIQNA
jgi:hypothetical protein